MDASNMTDANEMLKIIKKSLARIHKMMNSLYSCWTSLLISSETKFFYSQNGFLSSFMYAQYVAPSYTGLYRNVKFFLICYIKF